MIHHSLKATKEIQPGWGYWNFLKLEVNEFDLKQRPSPEILEIISNHKSDPEIFKHNFFIYNDPNKSPLKNMVVDEQLKKIMWSKNTRTQTTVEDSIGSEWIHNSTF